MKRTPAAGQLRLTTTAPSVVVAPTLQQLRTRKKLLRVDLARFLAALKVFHEVRGRIPPDFQGAINVPVPIEVLEMAGKLLSAGKWLEMANAVRAREARREDRRLQAQADKIWLHNSRLSKSNVAEMIAPGRANTVRQKITKPQK
jgi:hypothetical protein